MLLTVAALLGGGASAGILALAGAFRGGGSSTMDLTTVVESSSSGVSDGSSTGLDARAVYTATSAGVVQITATGTGSTQQNPCGQGSSQSEATGSGFVVDGNGNIVTAAHVVDGRLDQGDLLRRQHAHSDAEGRGQRDRRRKC